MSSPYYQPSDRVPLRAAPLALAALAAAVVLGWLYAWLTVHLPFVLNVVIALLFASKLADFAGRVARQGRVRNPRCMAWTGVAIGAAGWYSQRVAWSLLTAPPLAFPPFFSAFLDNSAAIVRAALAPQEQRAWHEAMRRRLDAAGVEEVDAWLGQELAS